MENKEIVEEIKKKRGRKPKNSSIEENIQIIEKKKRGRKKKYELENFDKIINRNELNNFNHNIVYSDNETEEEDSNTKNILFGNLNITVSKKNTIQTNENCFKGLLNKGLINEEEMLSDEGLDLDELY